MFGTGNRTKLYCYNQVKREERKSDQGMTQKDKYISGSQTLEDSDFVDTWLWCLAASARTKKLKDDKEKGGENEITDLFLAIAGCEVIMKVFTMAYPIYNKPRIRDFWKN